MAAVALEPTQATRRAADLLISDAGSRHHSTRTISRTLIWIDAQFLFRLEPVVDVLAVLASAGQV